MFIHFSGLDLTEEGKSTGQKKKDKRGTRQFTDMKKMFSGIINDFEHDSIQTFVIELKELTNFNVVTSLFPEYLRDRTGTELPYGEYRILGKVVRKLKEGDSISLLGSSAFAGFGEDNLEQFLKPFRDLDQELFKLPEIITKVKGPAFQIIPIAIYV
jgi:hypothetical protein